MSISRFFALTWVVIVSWLLNTSCQASDPLPAIAPSFTLPNHSEQDKQVWSSSSVLGESPLVLFFATKGTELIPAYSQLVVVTSNTAVLTRLQNATKTSGTPLLWDEKNTLRHQFQLQKFSIAPTQSALAIIDRAGWLRAVHKIENTGQKH